MAIIEIIYDVNTLKIAAMQEFPEERPQHDWGFSTDQALVVLQGTYPSGPLGQYKMTADLKGIELDPSYVSSDDKLLTRQGEWDSDVASINAATTVAELQPLLLKLLGTRPEKEEI